MWRLVVVPHDDERPCVLPRCGVRRCNVVVVVLWRQLRRVFARTVVDARRRKKRRFGVKERPLRADQPRLACERLYKLRRVVVGPHLWAGAPHCARIDGRVSPMLDQQVVRRAARRRHRRANQDDLRARQHSPLQLPQVALEVTHGPVRAAGHERGLIKNDASQPAPD